MTLLSWNNSSSWAWAFVNTCTRICVPTINWLVGELNSRERSAVARRQLVRSRKEQPAAGMLHAFGVARWGEDARATRDPRRRRMLLSRERASERFYAGIGRMGREDPLGCLHINDGGARGTGSQIRSRSNRQSRTQTDNRRRRYAVSSEWFTSSKSPTVFWISFSFHVRFLCSLLLLTSLFFIIFLDGQALIGDEKSVFCLLNRFWLRYTKIVLVIIHVKWYKMR